MANWCWGWPKYIIVIGFSVLLLSIIVLVACVGFLSKSEIELVFRNLTSSLSGYISTKASPELLEVP